MSDANTMRPEGKPGGNISAPFVLRPVATTLMAIAIMLSGLIAFPFLPVANMPAVEFPTLRIYVSRPGADPETMAQRVAAPLERALGTISGVTELTSDSWMGRTRISIQFALSRDIVDAQRDVQAALNAAIASMPADLPSFPRIRKYNPASRPILLLAMTSTTLPPSGIYDIADTLVAQRIAQVKGVGDVTVSGAEQPAIRVRVDPAKLAAIGIGIDKVRTAIVSANAQTPVGAFDGGRRMETLGIKTQLTTPAEYRRIVVHSANGSSVRLGDVAQVSRGTRNRQSAGWFNEKPAVLIVIRQETGANVLETIDGVRAILPKLNELLPAGVNLQVMQDRAQTVRASVHELELTLIISIALVTLVVFLFLRRLASTFAAAITVPLSLAGTFGAMWVAGFTIDNLSLMAIIIAVGFVIDDAIVMIENIHRNMERGMGRLQAALAGTRQIGFTVVSISLSLIAAFIPLIFMHGIVGRVFREFSLTLCFAILVSMFVSLTVTPMISAYLEKPHDKERRTFFDRVVEGFLDLLLRHYSRSLTFSLRHPVLVMIVFAVTAGLTVHLYRTTPKGWMPRGDSGLLFVWAQGADDASFDLVTRYSRQATEIMRADPAVESVAAFMGTFSSNSGRMYIALKPFRERKASAGAIAARLRRKLAPISGMRFYVRPMRSIRVGARQSRSEYEFTLWGPDNADLMRAAKAVEERLNKLPQLEEVSSDRDEAGLQANVIIDRTMAARLGVPVNAISAVLTNAFSQRQVASIYTGRNNYRVILEISPSRQRDPSDIMGLYVTASDGKQVPLASIARIERSVATQSVSHQSGFPSITFSYELAQGHSLDSATTAIRQAVARMDLPESVKADFAGDAKAFQENANNQLWLILAALIAVYIILGVLYESLIHPVTIISTLPSAGLGALIALNLFGQNLGLVAFIGIIMLIGIVKKNGIMMVDFAIAAERARNLTPAESIHEACLHRFRPILMTTLAALFGALPLALATGPGAEMRVPLGITIVGGLILSQILTLYTTPVIYLLMSKLQRDRSPSRLQRVALNPAE